MERLNSWVELECFFFEIGVSVITRSRNGFPNPASSCLLHATADETNCKRRKIHVWISIEENQKHTQQKQKKRTEEKRREKFLHTSLNAVCLATKVLRAFVLSALPKLKDEEGRKVSQKKSLLSLRRERICTLARECGEQWTSREPLYDEQCMTPQSLHRPQTIREMHHLQGRCDQSAPKAHSAKAVFLADNLIQSVPLSPEEFRRISRRQRLLLWEAVRWECNARYVTDLKSARKDGRTSSSKMLLSWWLSSTLMFSCPSKPENFNQAGKFVLYEINNTAKSQSQHYFLVLWITSPFQLCRIH